ncbi:hypothetical protein [Actinobaculum sp. oral taxon 183]|uniref:hypothetical protein n=1 Tax=Actinobaculum sp. oral taxon 183 TaxID=712888 RepID=UPI000686F6CE|nr:hypothetical protein [Actinobaculum sp. oral taxon 183]
MNFRIKDLFNFASSPGPTGRAPQRWAKAACWTAFLSPLPSACWRIAMLAGADTGFAEAALYRSNASGIAYVLCLDALQISAAALCLGLCYGWGEKVPQWVPRLGGKTIHRRLAVTVGGAGAFALFIVVGEIAVQIIGVSAGAWDGWTPMAGMNAGQRAALIAAYTPAALWPFALTVGLVGYWRRRAPG